MTDNAYPKLAGGAPDFPALELGVLNYWTDDDTFRASVARRDGAPEYVFYDGPPFANGLPHYGHLLTGYVKDIVPRYRTMRGYKVERRFGWDTSGCRPNWKSSVSWASPTNPRSTPWGSPLSTTPVVRRCCAIPTSGGRM